MFKVLSSLLLLGFTLTLLGCSEPAAEKKTPANKRPTKTHLVETITVVNEAISRSDTLTGSLRSRRVVRVFNQEEGQILRFTLFEGDRVNQGQTLMVFDSRLLHGEMDKAKAETLRARALVKRLNRLSKSNLASDDELAEAKKSLAVAQASERLINIRLSFTQINAPFSGVISQRLVEPGDVVPRYTHLLTITDPDSLIIELTVSELLLPYLHTKQEVEIQIDALGATRHQGVILRIHPEVDADSRRGTVEIALNPVPKGARSGQFARVTLRTQAKQRLLIPFAALRRDHESLFVYQITDNTAQRVNIRTGLKFDHRIEVLSGLNADDVIVLRGFMGLSDGKKVAITTPYK